MSASTAPGSEQLCEALREELLRLSQHEEGIAACEAQRVHYWEPTPITVGIHRQCAAALRAAADELPYPATRGSAADDGAAVRPTMSPDSDPTFPL